MADMVRIKDKVQSILASKFNTSLTERGGFSIRNGSTQLTIDLNQPVPPDGAVFIAFLIPVLWEVPVSPEVFRHVALHADDYTIGHLSAFENDKGSLNLFMSHALLGDFLDEEELTSTVTMMLVTADELDDELQKTFGGRRYHEDN